MSKNIQLWFLIASTGPVIWFEINFWIKTKCETVAIWRPRVHCECLLWKISCFLKVKKVKIWKNQWFLRNLIGQSYIWCWFSGREISCDHFDTLFVTNYVEMSILGWCFMLWCGIRLHWRVQSVLCYDIGTPYFGFLAHF